MSVETSLMIIAICTLFLSLCTLIFLAIGIKVAIGLSKHIACLSEKTSKVLQDGTEIAGKIKDNIDATKPVFHSIAKVGSMMNSFTEKFSDEERERPFRKIVSYPSSRGTESKILDLLEFLGLGLLMWKKIKKGVDHE